MELPICEHKYFGLLLNEKFEFWWLFIKKRLMCYTEFRMIDIIKNLKFLIKYMSKIFGG